MSSRSACVCLTLPRPGRWPALSSGALPRLLLSFLAGLGAGESQKSAPPPKPSVSDGDVSRHSVKTMYFWSQCEL